MLALSLLALVASSSVTVVAAPPPKGEELEVEFDGDEERAVAAAGAGASEVEVDFEGDEERPVAAAAEDTVEVVERVQLADLPLLPEYDRRDWLWMLPSLALALVAWNVRWRPPRREHHPHRRGVKGRTTQGRAGRRDPIGGSLQGESGRKAT